MSCPKYESSYLSSIVQQCQGMPPTHLRAIPFSYAQQIVTLNRITNYNSELDRLTTLVNQLAARLESSFELTAEQQVILLIQALFLP